MIDRHVVTLSHHWEGAHRLPHLDGKCHSLHGHSWQVSVDIGAPELTALGTVVEFGAFKRGFREWVDDNFDHATMLGQGDPLLADPVFTGTTKIYRFTDPYPWPTVELIAAKAADIARLVLDRVRAHPATATEARILQVAVRETDHNTAVWRYTS